MWWSFAILLFLNIVILDNDKDEGIFFILFIDLVYGYLFFSEYKSEIYYFLEWFIWVVVIGALVAMVAYFLVRIKRKKEEEQQREEADKLLRQHREEADRVYHQLHKEKLETLALLEQKNKQLAEDVGSLKRIVPRLSIYDDDFLDMQPQVLQYINDAIAQGKV